MEIKLEDLMKLLVTEDMIVNIWNNNVDFYNDDSNYKKLLHDYGAINVIEIAINAPLVVITLEDNTDGISN